MKLWKSRFKTSGKKTPLGGKSYTTGFDKGGKADSFFRKAFKKGRKGIA